MRTNILIIQLLILRFRSETRWIASPSEGRRYRQNLAWNHNSRLYCCIGNDRHPHLRARESPKGGIKMKAVVTCLISPKLILVNVSYATKRER